MKSTKALLSIKNLECTRDYKRLFDDISFELYEGESLIIKGENGSGKTSLILALLNLIPYSGQILWSKYIDVYGYVSHKDAIKSHETVEEYMEFWSKFYNYTLNYNLILSDLGLSSNLYTPSGFLSQGQKKRLSLARLLLVNTKVWFLDEPNASLDSKSKEIIIKKIEKHNLRGGISIISSHENMKIKKSKMLEI